MKISKRDRNLLIFLGVILIFAGYYFFLMKPTEEKIKSLKDTVSQAESKQAEIRGKLATEEQLNRNITKSRRRVLEISESYYTELYQEEALMIVYNIVKELQMNLEQFTFERVYAENLMDKTHKVDVHYNGDYKDLLAFLREVRQHPKRVFVRNITIESQGDITEGHFQLEFNVLSSMMNFSREWLHYVETMENTRDITTSPFVPFEDFIIASEVPEIPEVIIPETEEVDYESYRPKTKIYGFEDGAFFFVGNTSEIQGVLTRSKTKVEGGYSASLNIDFTNAREYSEASLVFDSEGIQLNRQPETIGLWIYAQEASNHNIGVELMDAAGKNHKIELTKGVDFTQWKEVEAKLPVGITYPCKVVRIYVEGVGYEQKLTGKYLFDQLQVSYPVD